MTTDLMYAGRIIAPYTIDGYDTICAEVEVNGAFRLKYGNLISATARKIVLLPNKRIVDPSGKVAYILCEDIVGCYFVMGDFKDNDTILGVHATSGDWVIAQDNEWRKKSIKIDIWRPLITGAGELIHSAPVTKDAKIIRKLGGDYYVELPFNVSNVLPLTKGCFIYITDSTDGQTRKFKLKSDASPEPISGVNGYKYVLKFYAEQHDMEACQIKWFTYGEGKVITKRELSFRVTTSLRGFAQLIAENMNEYLGFTDDTEVPGAWLYDDTLDDTDMREQSFEGVSCWDAINNIANLFGVEWWIDHGRQLTIRFGKCENGENVDIEEGGIVNRFPAPKRGEDSNYGTRFYIFGGTQNVPENYPKGSAGSTNNSTFHIAEKRICLRKFSDVGQDLGYISYFDAIEGLPQAEIVEKTIILDHIFPKNEETIGVGCVISTDEPVADGTQAKVYSIKLHPEATKPTILGTLGITFTAGALAGRSFDAQWIDAWQAIPPMIRIEYTTENSGGSSLIVVPNEHLAPKDGDTYILTGVDLGDDAITDAEHELWVEGTGLAKKYANDTNVYECPVDPVYCSVNRKNFDLGQKVTLKGAHFGGNGRISRIQGYEKKLYNPYLASYDIGDNTVYSRIVRLSKELTAPVSIAAEAQERKNNSLKISSIGKNDLAIATINTRLAFIEGTDNDTEEINSIPGAKRYALEQAETAKNEAINRAGQSISEATNQILGKIRSGVPGITEFSLVAGNTVNILAALDPDPEVKGVFVGTNAVFDNVNYLSDRDKVQISDLASVLKVTANDAYRYEGAIINITSHVSAEVLQTSTDLEAGDVIIATGGRWVKINNTLRFDSKDLSNPLFYAGRIIGVGSQGYPYPHAQVEINDAFKAKYGDNESFHTSVELANKRIVGNNSIRQLLASEYEGCYFVMDILEDNDNILGLNASYGDLVIAQGNIWRKMYQDIAGLTGDTTGFAGDVTDGQLANKLSQRSETNTTPLARQDELDGVIKGVKVNGAAVDANENGVVNITLDAVQAVKINGEIKRPTEGIVDLGTIESGGGVVDFANDLTGVIEATPEMFTYRPSAGDKSVRDESAVIRRIKGNTIVWGQLADITQVSNVGARYIMETGDGWFSIQRDLSNPNTPYCRIDMDKQYAIPTHKYLFSQEIEVSGIVTSDDYCSAAAYNFTPYSGVNYTQNGKYSYTKIITKLDDTTFQFFYYAYGNAKLRVSNIQCFDLTTLFGAGNEPTTYDEFRKYYPDAYYPYCKPEVRSMRATGIETIGFNAFNGEYAEVIGGQTYYLGGVIDTAHFATEIGGELKEITIPENSLYTPPTNGYIYATGSDICINISHSGVRNGEYKPYEKNTLLLPEIAKYFPEGMHGIGDVCDEIIDGLAIQRCATRTYVAGDENNAEVKTDKVNTVYKLTVPVYTHIDEPLQLAYKVDDFGTEKMLSDAPSAPFKADIVYQFNAEGRIRDNARNIQKLEDKIHSLANTTNVGASPLVSDNIHSLDELLPNVVYYHTETAIRLSIPPLKKGDSGVHNIWKVLSAGMNTVVQCQFEVNWKDGITPTIEGACFIELTFFEVNGRICGECKVYNQ